MAGQSDGFADVVCTVGQVALNELGQVGFGAEPLLADELFTVAQTPHVGELQMN
jgi:hypothetical protein